MALAVSALCKEGKGRLPLVLATNEGALSSALTLDVELHWREGQCLPASVIRLQLPEWLFLDHW